MSEFRLFDGRIRTDEAIQKLDKLMELSFRNNWNVDFSLPDIGQYPSLLPLPEFRWASMLLYLLKGTESDYCCDALKEFGVCQCENLKERSEEQ